MAVKGGTGRKPDRPAGRTKLGKLAFASLIGMALLTGLLFLTAWICLRSDASSGWTLQFAAYLCCAVSAFPVGCFAAKAVGRSGLLCGLLAALPLCILLLILCFALYGSVGAGFLIGAVLILFFGACGGIAALNIRRKRRYR